MACRPEIVCDATIRPATVSANAFAVPLCPSTHTSTNPVPLTVAPDAGLVMATTSEFWTVT